MDETGRIYYDSCFDFPRKVEKWKAIVGASNDNERCVSSRIPAKEELLLEEEEGEKVDRRFWRG